MKKKFLVLFLALVMCFSLTACKDKEENNPANDDQQQNQQQNNSTGTDNLSDLNTITDKIIAFFQTDKAANYTNLVSYYIDAGNNKVVVELKDNSKEAQEWFKENIVNSDKIEFTKSEE